MLSAPEFISGLVGALVGGLFALLGAWLHMRHTDTRAARLLMRRLRQDIVATQRSYAFWMSNWDKKHHSGKYFTPRAIQPIGLAGRADADLLLLPKSVRDRVFAINAAISEFNATIVPENQDFVDALEDLHPARDAEQIITSHLDALNEIVARRLREPVAPAASQSRLVKR